MKTTLLREEEVLANHQSSTAQPQPRRGTHHVNLIYSHCVVMQRRKTTHHYPMFSLFQMLVPLNPFVIMMLLSQSLYEISIMLVLEKKDPTDAERFISLLKVTQLLNNRPKI